MAGKIYKKSKLQGLDQFATALFADLKSAGLTQVLPASGQNFTVSAGAGKFVFDSSAGVNPLNETQPWRLLVDLSGATAGAGAIKMAIANPQQISTAGATTSYPGSAVDNLGTRVMGQLGNKWTPTNPVLGDTFINRQVQNSGYDLGTTLSYLLVATPRGISLFVWEDASDANPRYSFFNVQVPVNKDTGVALITDNSPIFVVYECDTSGPMKFVVNEKDVFRPAISKPADSDSVNSAAILNSQDQVAIAKGNKYLVTFPNRLNTDRYAYTEELDMFAYTSADVIGEESEIPVRVYGETSDRIYRAMKANKPNNAGMRLLLLVSGGGVPEAV